MSSIDVLQAYESPLLVAIAAGAVALPTLLKLSAILESQGQSITSMEELPVELELGKVCMLGSCSFSFGASISLMLMSTFT